MGELTLHLHTVLVRLHNLISEGLCTQTHVLQLLLLVLLTHSHEGRESLQVRVQLPVALLKHVRFLVENIHVLLKRAVLFFSFNECCDYFFNVHS